MDELPPIKAGDILLQVNIVYQGTDNEGVDDINCMVMIDPRPDPEQYAELYIELLLKVAADMGRAVVMRNARRN